MRLELVVRNDDGSRVASAGEVLLHPALAWMAGQEPGRLVRVLEESVQEVVFHLVTEASRVR